MGQVKFETLTNQQALTPEIDEFIDSSANGALYHRPHFLAYHDDPKLERNRVVFRHLLFSRKSKTIGFLPGALVETDEGMEYRSPWGASFGGLVVRGDARFSEMQEMVSIWQQEAAAWGARRIQVTLTPNCYQREPAQSSVEFAMQSQGFQCGDATLMMVARVHNENGFPESHLEDDARRRVRRSEEQGCTTRLGNVDEFWPLLEETMSRHGTSATHTRTELDTMRRDLPSVVSIHMAYFEDTAIGGIVVFDIGPSAATTFYICSRDDYRHLNPTNLLCCRVLQWARERGLQWVDYGPSSFGCEPHNSLIRFKEQHAGRGMLRRTMTAKLAD